LYLYLLFSSSNPYRRITIPIRYRRSHAQHNKVKYNNSSITYTLSIHNTIRIQYN
jgi:hypothetical protein